MGQIETMWLEIIEKIKKKAKIRLNSIACVLLFMSIGVFFYILNANVPLRNDDFVYSFIFTEGQPLLVDVNAPIRNVGDIFVSQYHHYFLMNGRTPIQFLVQLFSGILGKEVFDVCTSIIYSVFILGITRLIFWKESTFFHYLGVSSLIWLLLPVSVFYAFGISFAINYLWSLTACIWFLLLYRKVKERVGLQNFRKSYRVILLASFFAGWSHESFSIGIAGALVLCSLLDYKNMKKIEVGMVVAFCLGVTMIALSPGTLGRFNETRSGMSLLGFLYSRIGTLLLMKRFALFLLCLMIFVVFRWLNLKAFYKQNKFFIYVVGIELFFIIMIGFVNERSLFGVDFFSLVLLVCILKQLPVTKKTYWKYAVIPLFCISIYIVVNVTLVLSVVNKEFSSIIKGYLNDKNGITYMENLEITPYYYKYVNRLYPDSWEVKAISAYYRKTMSLFPYSYKEYLFRIDSYLLPENRVEGNSGLYEIPGTGVFVTQVDFDGRNCEYSYKFEYLPVTVEDKYSFGQMWHRKFYENLYNEFEKKVRPFAIEDKYIILIDNGVYKERKLKSICLKKECGELRL